MEPGPDASFFLGRGAENHPPRRKEMRQTRNVERRGRRAGKRKQAKRIGEGIFNLSDKPLTQKEIGVLDKGLKYAHIKILDSKLVWEYRSIPGNLTSRSMLGNPIKYGLQPPQRNEEILQSNLRNTSF